MFQRPKVTQAVDATLKRDKKEKQKNRAISEIFAIDISNVSVVIVVVVGNFDHQQPVPGADQKQLFNNLQQSNKTSTYPGKRNLHDAATNGEFFSRTLRLAFFVKFELAIRTNFTELKQIKETLETEL